MNTTKCRALQTLAISTAMIIGAATAASAKTTDSQSVGGGTHQYVVRFQDLDLGKFDGIAALYGRLSHAANLVCRSLESKDLTINAMFQRCVAQAVASAVTRVDRPQLSQYHETRTKGDKGNLVQLARVN